MKRNDYLRQTSPAEEYHAASAISVSDTAFSQVVFTVNSSARIRRVISGPHAHPLPAEASVLLEYPGENGLSAIMRSRQTALEMRDSAEMPQAQLAMILLDGAGVVRHRSDADGAAWHLRPYPSGGALYVVDLFVFCRNVEGVRRGLYRFDPHGSCLVPYGDADDEAMHRGLLEHPLYTASSVVGLLRADMRRMRFKYGERSYRFALLESGHLVQNVLLLAAAAQLAAVPIGGFLDADVNVMLRADGVTEFCTYAFLLGTP